MDNPSVRGSKERILQTQRQNERGPETTTVQDSLPAPEVLGDRASMEFRLPLAGRGSTPLAGLDGLAVQLVEREEQGATSRLLRARRLSSCTHSDLCLPPAGPQARAA